SHSAGILVFKYVENAIHLLLVHPGGPFWVRKDDGAWSIPKGLFEAGEEPQAAARREFRAETGFDVVGKLIGLGSLKQPSGKVIHAWAAEQDLDAAKIVSNTFTLEWPKHSGRLREFPEIDRGQWFAVAEARVKIQKGQAGFIDALIEKLQGNLCGKIEANEL
ncbi:MAG: NUDIX domain-containing protein, partial [Gammaproteobacteria bacterium]